MADDRFRAKFAKAFVQATGEIPPETDEALHIIDTCQEAGKTPEQTVSIVLDPKTNSFPSIEKLASENNKNSDTVNV